MQNGCGGKPVEVQSRRCIPPRDEEVESSDFLPCFGKVRDSFCNCNMVEMKCIVENAWNLSQVVRGESLSERR